MARANPGAFVLGGGFEQLGFEAGGDGEFLGRGGGGRCFGEEGDGEEEESGEQW